MAERQAPWLRTAKHGLQTDAPGLVVREVCDRQYASLKAYVAADAELQRLVSREFDVRLPVTPRVEVGRGLAFVWSGPAHWLVEAERGQPPLEPLLASALGSLAAVTDQTDSRIVLDLRGPRVRDVLAKGVPIDLHPAVFAPGMVALCAVGHVSVQIWQLAAAPEYRIAVARSYIESFMHWLVSSSRQYGCEIVAGGTSRQPSMTTQDA